MGLFSRKPAPEAAPPVAPAPPDDPLGRILGLAVDAAAYADGTLTLTFVGGAGEAHLEAFGKLKVIHSGESLDPTRRGFDAAVSSLVGRKVGAASQKRGEELAIEFEGGVAVVASLKGGDYPGTSAVYLKGPGKSYVNFHRDGFTRLAL